MKEANLPPCQWSVERIFVIHPGKDSKIRVVDINTAVGNHKRPVSKLCLLQMNELLKELFFAMRIIIVLV